MSSCVSDIYKVGDTMTSVSNLWQCLTIFTVKKHFLCSEEISGVFNLFPLPFVPWLGTTGRSPGSFIFFSSHMIFTHVHKTPLSFPFSRQNSPWGSHPLLTWGVSLSLTNVLNSIGPSTSLWGYAPACLQCDFVPLITTLWVQPIGCYLLLIFFLSHLCCPWLENRILG